jgi:hypothetical protein
MPYPDLTRNEDYKVRVKAFYRWLCGFLGDETDEKWSLYPCNIEPGPDPFSVDIDSAPKEPIERDSIAHLSPGAYIILVDSQIFSRVFRTV